ncbi:MAG: hypothetical protein J7L82_00040, partial [Staphylothermus sp.]|nr:hypothetical protein [Staphylothermus sp.]
GQEYRPILFFLAWFLVLEIVSIVLAYTTGYHSVIPLMLIMLVSTFIMFIYMVYKARKAILEQL